MSLYARLRAREQRGLTINVAVAGAGLIGRGTVYQVDLTPGMRTALIVNRTLERAVEAFVHAGRRREEIIVSDDPETLRLAIADDRPAVTTRIEHLEALPDLDAVVEVTGAVSYGAQVALHAIGGGLHVIMMNAETDAIVGCALKHHADARNVVYTNSDGDQPGVLNRLIETVDGMGFGIIAAVNCKGFMDTHASPDTIREWAEKQNTSLQMTTAFTDGTKMNIENAVLCNATGLVPETRGMHGVETDLTHALDDCLRTFASRGLVDYTLGGDFKGGVFVIGHGDHPEMTLPYMNYLKMGEGPYYLFYRPYHLCHLETPVSIAEAVLDGQPTIAPRDRPVAEVVAIAKRDLQPGDRLDGIGGYTCYGEVDVVENTCGLLPIGLSENAHIVHPIEQDQPIPLNAVELDEDHTLTNLRGEQMKLVQAA